MSAADRLAYVVAFSVIVCCVLAVPSALKNATHWSLVRTMNLILMLDTRFWIMNSSISYSTELMNVAPSEELNDKSTGHMTFRTRGGIVQV